MVNKTGDQKYYIIVSLILGLVILTISLYWIFGEFFDEGEIDWEVCRQSVILRAGIPDTSEKFGKNFKDALALKCKTEVIEVDGESYEDINKIFADTVANCWYMYGEGKLDFFVTEYWSGETYAMVCARLKFSPEVLEKMNNGEIDGDPSFKKFYETTRLESNERTYVQYLPYYDFDKEEGNFIKWMDFIVSSDENYFVVYTKYKNLGGAKFLGEWFSGKLFKDSERSVIQLIPEKYLAGQLEDVEVLTIPA